MKPPKEIPRRAAKLKRGTELIVIETSQKVTLDRVKDNGDYFCLTSLNQYETFEKSHVKEAKMIRTGLTNVPKAKTPEQKSKGDARNVFFKEMGHLVPANCMECGEPLFAYTDWAKRCVTAHIFEKSHFPSIENNPDNIVFLGAALLCKCGCHDAMDKRNSDFRKTMRIYPLLLERFEKLKPLMTRDELKRAYTFLGVTFQ